jgi:hypothetical protein
MGMNVLKKKNRKKKKGTSGWLVPSSALAVVVVVDEGRGQLGFEVGRRALHHVQRLAVLAERRVHHVLELLQVRAVAELLYEETKTKTKMKTKMKTMNG